MPRSPRSTSRSSPARTTWNRSTSRSDRPAGGRSSPGESPSRPRPRPRLLSQPHGESKMKRIPKARSRGLHPDRAPGRDRDHRGPDRPAAARGAGGPRGRPPRPVRQQHEADGPGLHELREHQHQVPDRQGLHQHLRHQPELAARPRLHRRRPGQQRTVAPVDLADPDPPLHGADGHLQPDQPDRVVHERPERPGVHRQRVEPAAAGAQLGLLDEPLRLPLPVVARSRPPSTTTTPTGAATATAAGPRSRPA